MAAEPFLELGPPDAMLAMTGDTLKDYVFSRTLPDDPILRAEQIEEMRRIVVHNGLSTPDVESLISLSGGFVHAYKPSHADEMHYYDRSSATLHVVNMKGRTRLLRDRELAAALHLLTKVDQFEIHHLANNPILAGKRFETLSHELADDVATHLVDLSLDKTLLEQQVVNLVLGPHRSLPDMHPLHLSSIADNHGLHEFLPYKILLHKDQVFITFDDPFAEQAHDVLRAFYAILNDSYPGIAVNVLKYAKNGLLYDKGNIGMLCIPNGGCDGTGQYALSRPPYLEFPNALLDPTAQHHFISGLRSRGLEPLVMIGSTVNTNTVIRQTIPWLMYARGLGDFIEQEWLDIYRLHLGLSNPFPDLGTVRCFSVGIASDKPLSHQNLGNTRYPAETERAVASALLDLPSTLLSQR